MNARIQKDLNIVKSRGRWYVYDRTTKEPFISGFSGSREELQVALADAVEFAQHQTADIREKACRSAIVRAKKRSVKRSMDFDLTLEWMIDRLAEQKNKCLMTGIPLFFGATSRATRGHRIHPKAMTIDRKDNRKGYTTSNCRLICNWANISINDWGDDIFKEMVERTAYALTK